MLQGQNFAEKRCHFVCNAVQRVHATELTFQPIANNDQNSSRSSLLALALGKTNIEALDIGVRFHWDR